MMPLEELDPLASFPEPEKQRILILVGSAGIEPWSTIELEGQQPILSKVFGNQANLLWVQGDSQRSKTLVARFLSWLFGVQISAMYTQNLRLRKILKFIWRRIPWPAVGSAILRTYARARTRKVKFSADETRCTLDYPVDMSLQGPRVIKMFELSLAHYDFDYLLRLTSTSLASKRLILDFLESAPRIRVYAGHQQSFLGVAFQAGSSILFSRDVVEGIVKHRNKWRLNLHEDVAIGDLIARFDLADLVDMPRLELSSADQLSTFSEETLREAVVLRCKAEKPTTTQSDPVVRIMKSVAHFLT